MEVYNKNDVDVTFSNCFMDLEQLTSFDAIPLDRIKQAKLEVEDIRELTKDGWKSPKELKEEFIEILNKLIEGVEE